MFICLPDLNICENLKHIVIRCSTYIVISLCHTEAPVFFFHDLSLKFTVSLKKKMWFKVISFQMPRIRILVKYRYFIYVLKDYSTLKFVKISIFFFQYLLKASWQPMSLTTNFYLYYKAPKLFVNWT